MSPDAIRQLDVSDMSGHWARAQAFIGIADHFVDAPSDQAMDAQARQLRVVKNLIAPLAGLLRRNIPVILAGSTGSRGTTLMLMQAVARLPQGALDPAWAMTSTSRAHVWDRLDEALTSEDHPQYRFRKLMRELGTWSMTRSLPMDGFFEPPSPARNRLVSLALRPAPYHRCVDDQKAPCLTELDQATSQRPDTGRGSTHPASEALGHRPSPETSCG